MTIAKQLGESWPKLAELAKRWKTWLELGENLSFIKFSGWPNDTQLLRSCELGSSWLEMGGPFDQGFSRKSYHVGHGCTHRAAVVEAVLDDVGAAEPARGGELGRQVAVQQTLQCRMREARLASGGQRDLTQQFQAPGAEHGMTDGYDEYDMIQVGDKCNEVRMSIMWWSDMVYWYDTSMI